MVITYRGLRTQRLEALARIEREIKTLNRVVPRAGRQAFEQKREAPPPLSRVGAQPKQQRRIGPAEPLQDLQRHARIRPRLCMRCGNLSAVGERRFQRDTGLAIDDRHLVAVCREIPRRRDADNAATEHQYAHQPSAGSSSTSAVVTGTQLQKRFRSP